MVLQQDFSKVFSFNTNVNIYRNIIEPFTVQNKYPVPSIYTATKEQFTSGNIKLNGIFHLPKQTDIQITSIYLAPDIIPQGKIGKKEISGNGFKLNSTDYYETQVFRLGYSYKF